MSKIEKLKQIMSELRDTENGCPWDIEQTFESISPHTIEEAYEVANAIDLKDYRNLKEELGDLLLQVVFHSQIASEEKKFNFDDVIDSICNKLVARHPHVFGDETIETAQLQEKAWEEEKLQERKNKALRDNKEYSILDDIAITLPALNRSIKIQKRVSQVGFDWENLEGVFEKIDEELNELKQAIEENSNIEEEYGDLLFVFTNLARKLKIDPEISLKKANQKFIRRFNYIERTLNKDGSGVENATLEEMEDLWQKAKTF